MRSLRASRTSSAIRWRACSRFRERLRVRSAWTTRSPSRVRRTLSRSRSRPRCRLFRARLLRTFQRRVTFVLVLLTCCPPGPPERLAASRISAPGIEKFGAISRSLSPVSGTDQRYRIGLPHSILASGTNPGCFARVAPGLRLEKTDQYFRSTSVQPIPQR